ncbi:MAG TPA: 16S rRNA (uracil(1498)-N(3))-methyltransferase [Clostridiales bacterium]|nr:16S rRNA (uracil(1498)-N(3))-methyltransferase [Clostridiales bacterium]
MAWFFTDRISGDFHTLEGETANHIEKSLRMKVGEALTLCDCNKMQYNCVIEGISPKCVTVRVLQRFPCENEPTVTVTLYQAIPKGDKMDTIVQKAVELGVTEIVPVLSARCVSRPDEKSIKKKILRWQKIALQAAQQSRRGIVPIVKPMLSFNNAVSNSKKNECTIVFYECGGQPIGKVVPPKCRSLSMFIGSEGGFEEVEINQITSNGGKTATLGKRILRAETAPLAALSVIMYVTQNFD